MRVAGLIVSNHGARNLDTVPATVEALPWIAEAVKGRIPLLPTRHPPGHRCAEAIAFGAAVLIGRPHLYGLAASGARRETRRGHPAIGIRDGDGVDWQAHHRGNRSFRDLDVQAVLIDGEDIEVTEFKTKERRTKDERRSDPPWRRPSAALGRRASSPGPIFFVSSSLAPFLRFELRCLLTVQSCAYRTPDHGSRSTQ
jgi:hypothetical protein